MLCQSILNCIEKSPKSKKFFTQKNYFNGKHQQSFTDIERQGRT